MERYMVFGYEYHEANGGMGDFLFSCESIESIEQTLKTIIEGKDYISRVHILDLVTNKVTRTYEIADFNWTTVKNIINKDEVKKMIAELN